MKRNAILVILLICFLPMLFAGAKEQDIVRRSTGYPDLDLYYLQMERNTCRATAARQSYLLKTIPTDSLIMNFIERGCATYRDTANLIPLFNVWHTLSKEEDLHEQIDKMYPIARKYKSKRLELLADLLKARQTIWDRDKEWEDKMEKFEILIRKAQKAGEKEMEVNALEYMWYHNFHSLRYAKCFIYAQRLEEALEKVGDDYPNKSCDYFNIGRSYYMFKDYDRALPLIYKAISIEGYHLGPWNYLAVYHQMNGNLDSSVYYNRAILRSEHSKENDPINLAIAISNLGRIEQEKGNIDAACAMLEAGFDHVKDRWDINFKSGVHISLGEIYLEKGDMVIVKEHITAARNLINELLKAGVEAEPQKRLKSLYALESSYYARLGRHDLAKIYQDSAFAASAKYEQLSGKHIILLGEQQLQEAEAQFQSRQIARQKNVILIVIAALIVILGVLLIIIRLYRNRDAAYKALALKAQEWAMQSGMANRSAFTTSGNETTHIKNGLKMNGDIKEPPTEEDMRIMLLANKVMTEQFAYREAGLTMESFADRIGIRRNIFSRAINKVTGSNFNQYINSYRIKEAVRIISEYDRSQLYIDELYERVGFSSRTSFYRVFKQFTGLSPIEFQKKKNLIPSGSIF